ncbi:hypothetical protein BJX61DRAFT_96536 [Aspergillus egyptiacus]|nr:hypothetical protein BJX61DRAFT_96536 [Aspergillus egyptiacus]
MIPITAHDVWRTLGCAGKRCGSPTVFRRCSCLVNLLSWSRRPSEAGISPGAPARPKALLSHKSPLSAQYNYHTGPPNMAYSNLPRPYAPPAVAQYLMGSSDDGSDLESSEDDESWLAEYEARKARTREVKREMKRNTAPWEAPGRGNVLTLRQRRDWYCSLLDGLGFGYASSDLEEQEIVSVVPESDPSFHVKKPLWEDVRSAEQTVSDPMGDWPARLLDVTTMRSVEWQPGNLYAGVREPRYAIISYTWGRWKLDEDAPGNALEISGLSWKVPPVDPELFTVEEFQKVLNTITRDSDTAYVWVDIACIDQTPGSLENAREVGRQAKIFRNAHSAFIWLMKGYRYARATQDILWQLRDLECTFSKATAPPEPDPEMPLEKAEIDEWTFQSGYDSLIRIATLPWFTSLWTLQEGFLRPSAKLIVGDEYAMSENGYVITLQHLLTWCMEIHQLFPPVLPVRADTSYATAFVNSLQERGWDTMWQRDRLALYFTAKSRNASDPLDRIYAIMQVWGFALGKSAPMADPVRLWTLPELETELGKALLKDFPIESHLHVRLSPSKPGEAWRVSRVSSAVYHDFEFLETGHLAGSVDRRGSKLGVRQANGVVYAHFVGKACPFGIFLASWRQLEDSYQDPNEDGPIPHQNPPVRLVVDKTPLGYGPLGGGQCEVTIPDHELLNYAEKFHNHLHHTLHREISVLLLGTISQRGGASWIAIGLLVMDAPDKLIGGWQKRLGLVMWTSWGHIKGRDCYQAACDVMSTDSSHWGDFECIIG